MAISITILFTTNPPSDEHGQAAALVQSPLWWGPSLRLMCLGAALFLCMVFIPAKCSTYADDGTAPIYGSGKMLEPAVNTTGVTRADRDHCLCEKCTHPQTRQRQHNSFEVCPTFYPLTPIVSLMRFSRFRLILGSRACLRMMRVSRFAVRAPRRTSRGLRLTQESGDNDGHISRYSWQWLRSWRGSFRTLNSESEESIRQMALL